MTTDKLSEVGSAAYASIRDLVAASEVDFDRLGELRDERKSLEDDHQTAEDDEARSSDSTTEQALAEARNALYEWDKEYAEELSDLEDTADDCEDADDARQRIQEDPLSIRIFGERVDGEWTADKFEILLTTGGPAARIMGELDGTEPTRAWLEVQDWGTPWTSYYEPGIGATLLIYCQNFSFE